MAHRTVNEKNIQNMMTMKVFFLFLVRRRYQSHAWVHKSSATVLEVCCMYFMILPKNAAETNLIVTNAKLTLNGQFRIQTFYVRLET